MGQRISLKWYDHIWVGVCIIGWMGVYLYAFHRCIIWLEGKWPPVEMLLFNERQGGVDLLGLFGFKPNMDF
jgi:hypothetical protein